MPDRDSDKCGRRIVADALLRRLSAQQSEGLEIDAREHDAGLLAGLDVAVDQLAVRDNEEYALGRPTFLVDAVTEQLIVEDRLVDRDRQRPRARKRIALSSCFASAMLTMSNVLTPMRLFAMPSRTPRFGSLCLSKKSFSASVSASGSRAAATTMPGARASRAS